MKKISYQLSPSCQDQGPKVELFHKRNLVHEGSCGNKTRPIIPKFGNKFSRPSVKAKSKLTWLCARCTELGDGLYERWIHVQANIQILRYPRDTGCVLCTILHEGGTAMKREDDLEPTSALELKVLPLGYNDRSCLLRFVSVDIGNQIAENKSESKDLLFEYFRPEHREHYAKLLRPTGVDFNKIRQWLSSCVSIHYRSCNPVATESSMPYLNLMVMDCVEKRMILLPTGEIRYSTLSYVWGESQPSCSLDLGSEIDIHALERTIRDAIMVSLELGLRYLWVDRYCISQSNLTERDLQLQHMGEIYSNSFITIIACAGSDAETGLPGVGTTSRNNNLSVLAETWSLQSIAPQPTVEISDSAWFTRGWTFQEGMLARRRLIFSQSCVYFQCALGHEHEQVRKILDTERVTRRIELLPAIMDKGVFPRYGSGQQAGDILPLISQYWARRFTYETDALDAFRGILSNYMGFKGLAGHVQGLPLFYPGHWQNTSELSQVEMLSYCLAWNCLLGTYVTIRRREEFPSWTWAGWQLMGNDQQNSFRYCATLSSPSAVVQLKEETKGQLLALLDNDSDFGRSMTSLKQIALETWTAKIGLHDESDLPELRLGTNFQAGEERTKLYRHLALLAKERFHAAGCSSLAFDDMLLVPILASRAEYQTDEYRTLILCFDPSANGYIRLPHTVFMYGYGHDQGNGCLLLKPRGYGSGTAIFERRTITLV